MTERCPACRGPGKRLGLLIDSSYRLYRCTSCKTEFFRLDGDAPSTSRTSEQSEYWEPHKFAFYSDPRVRQAFARRYGAMIDIATRRVAPVHSILDVGCGTGNFLSFAERRGLRAVGVDVEPHAVAAARSRGLDSHQIDDLNALSADEPFDALTMWDVIEHVVDPYDTVRALLPRVRPGGTLMFETPDGAFPARRAVLRLHSVSRGRVDLTPPFYYWEHKVYFTEAGFRALMDRLGCEVVDVRRMTSVREKMAAVLGYEAATHATVGRRTLAAAWPALERVSGLAGFGNKLLIVARVRRAPDEADAHQTTARRPVRGQSTSGAP
jgi:2-polyprenyl-3-methyl-5-hydroxy-6-metoxy-1,4-benzoquinol methylase